MSIDSCQYIVLGRLLALSVRAKTKIGDTSRPGIARMCYSLQLGFESLVTRLIMLGYEQLCFYCQTSTPPSPDTH